MANTKGPPVISNVEGDAIARLKIPKKKAQTDPLMAFPEKTPEQKKKKSKSNRRNGRPKGTGPGRVRTGITTPGYEKQKQKMKTRKKRFSQNPPKAVVNSQVSSNQCIICPFSS